MTRVGLSLALVAGTYLLMLASVDPLDVAAGLVVAGGTLFGFRRFLFGHASGGGPGLLARALAFPPFVVAVLRDVTIGTWDVALIVLHLRPLRQPGIVAIPFGERSDVGVVVGALVATISPGELLVDIDRERRVMLLHVIDATDPDAVRRQHDAFYERFQRKVFP
jgi:multicomponent Na+:H+ antiporter subunit E